MANEFRADNSAVHDHLLKNVVMTAEVSIVANATPADKQHGSDIPGGLILRTEGKTEQADAKEDLSSQVAAPDDATGIFSILLDDAEVKKIHSVAVTPDVGTVAVTSAITTEGRLVIEVDSDQDLTSQDLTMLVEVAYLK